ncbi:heterokaryon incompatibility protein-domain-containing protein, partial [Pisolithus orientalis]|uniref:heterokaryon incompatibility protein-domain-containing protein n=1 Tax=Pisolithus orientalis TaxID=936130 RepID=UPI00222421CE
IRRVDPEIEVLKELDDNRASYAILSHRWGTEVTYDEMTGLAVMGTRQRDKIRQRDGYQKIIKSCEQANNDGYSWLWIDTCCIDKRSSAELSEAINSMYRWYRNSQMCYVYLNDVDDSAFPTEPDFGKFCRSKWFSRGWTLQELIAPRELEFFNKSWVPIGNKQDLTSTLEGIARIPEKVLRSEQVLRSWERPSVAQIMSWAADRRTTRMEDRAYSLMGLFGVNMPMLYGEGLKAFQRLQLEIIRTASSDCSIFAWNLKGQFELHKSVLADDPSCFRGCRDIEKVDPRWFVNELEEYLRQNRLNVDANRVELESLLRDVCSPLLSKFDVSNLGIQVSLPVVPIDHGDSDSYLTAVLPCRDRYGDLWRASEKQLGDYCGEHFVFERRGNIFEDMRELGIDPTDSLYCPVVSCVSSCKRRPRRMQIQDDAAVSRNAMGKNLALYQPKSLSLPNNEAFELLLRALSARLAGNRLVTTVIQCSDFYEVDDEGRRWGLKGASQGDSRSAEPDTFTPLRIISRPLAWHREPACARRRQQFKNIR